MKNRLVVAHANEEMSIAQNRVPSGADRVSSRDICRISRVISIGRRNTKLEPTLH